MRAQGMGWPAGKGAPATNVAPPEGMRERFLSRLAGEAVNAKDRVTQRPSPIRVLESISLPLGERFGGDTRKTALATGPQPGTVARLWRPLGAPAACGVGAVAGSYASSRRL